MNEQQPIPQDILPIKEDGEDEGLLWNEIGNSMLNATPIKNSHEIRVIVQEWEKLYHITRIKTPNQ